MKKVYIHSFKSKLGTIRTAATEKGLAVVMLPGSSARAFADLIAKNFPGYDIAAGGRINTSAQKQLTRYLDGGLKRFDLKLDLRGTGFSQKVLRRVSRIPYGKTMTYGDVARAVGSPGAARAVGSANASNLLPLVIPCHRVVAGSGLGGYGGGIKMKKRLLQLEGALKG